MNTTTRLGSLLLAVLMLLSCSLTTLAEGDAAAMGAEVAALGGDNQSETPTDPSGDEQPVEPEGDNAPDTDDEFGTPETEGAQEDGEPSGDAGNSAEVEGEKMPEGGDEPADMGDTPEPETPLTATLSDAVAANGTATFEVAVALPVGTEPTYRWQSLNTADLPAGIDGDELAAAREAAWVDVAGETAATLTLQGLTDEVRAVYEPMCYRCVVTLGDESVTTNEACVLFADMELADVVPLAEKTEVHVFGCDAFNQPKFVYTTEHEGLRLYSGIDYTMELSEDADLPGSLNQSLTVASVTFKSGEEAFQEAVSAKIKSDNPQEAYLSLQCYMLDKTGTATFTVRLESADYYAQKDFTLSVIEYEPIYVTKNKDYFYVAETGKHILLETHMTEAFSIASEGVYCQKVYYGDSYSVDNEYMTIDLDFMAKKPGRYNMKAEFDLYGCAWETHTIDVIVGKPYTLSAPVLSIKPGGSLQISAAMLGGFSSIESAIWSVTGSDFASIDQNGLLTLDEACTDSCELVVSLTPADVPIPSTLSIFISTYTGDKQNLAFSDYLTDDLAKLGTVGLYAAPKDISSYWSTILAETETGRNYEYVYMDTVTVERIDGDAALDNLFTVEERHSWHFISINDLDDSMVGQATYRLVGETDTYHAECTFTVVVKPWPNITFPTLQKQTVLINTIEQETDLSKQNIMLPLESGINVVYRLFCPEDHSYSNQHSRSSHAGDKNPKEQYDFDNGKFTPYAEATYWAMADVEYGLNLHAYSYFNILVSTTESPDDYALTLSTKNNVTALLAGDKLTVSTTFKNPAKVKNKTINWRLTDTAGNPLSADIATVSAKGVVSTSKNLTEPTTIRVTATSTYMGTSDSLDLQVNIKPTSVKIRGYEEESKPATTLAITEEDPNPTFDLGALVYVDPEKALTGYTYKTSKQKVATVDENGSVTAHSAGTAVITVTSVANTKAKATFTVNVEVPVTGIRITSKSGDTLRIGQSTPFVAELTPANATNKSVAWSVSPSDGHVSISQKGVLKADKDTPEGQGYTVTAVAQGYVIGERTASYQVVARQPVKSVTVAAKAYTLDVADELLADELGIVVSPAEANRNLDWTLNKPGIVRLEERDGQTAIVAQMPGVVTLTLSATDGSNKKAGVKLTVRQPVEAITLSGAGQLTAGMSTALTATVTPADATNKRLKWSSSDPNTATVSTSGKVTAKKGAQGEVTITATAQDQSGVSGSYTIIVTDVLPTAVHIDDTSTDVDMRSIKTVALSATCAPAQAAQSVLWTTSNKRIATVSEDGMVTFLSAGTVTITATSVASKKVKDSVTLTARQSDALRIQSVVTNARVLTTGQSVLWNVHTSGGKAPFKYEYSVYNTDTDEPTLVKKQKTSAASYTYKATKAGVYGVSVTVTDAVGQVATLALADNDNLVSVLQTATGELHIQNVTMVNETALSRTGGGKKGKGRNVHTVYIDDTMSFTVDAGGGEGSYTYHFYAQDQGENYHHTVGTTDGNQWLMDQWGKLSDHAGLSSNEPVTLGAYAELKDAGDKAVTWHTPVHIYKKPESTYEIHTLAVGDSRSFDAYYQPDIDGIRSLSATNTKVVKLDKKTGAYTASLPGTCTVTAELMSGAVITHNVTVPELACASKACLDSQLIVGQRTTVSFGFEAGKAPYTAQMVIKDESGRVVLKNKSQKNTTGRFEWADIRLAEPGVYTVECTAKDAAKKTLVEKLTLTVWPAGTMHLSLGGVEDGGEYGQPQMPLIITGAGVGYERVYMEITGPEGFSAESYTLTLPFEQTFTTDTCGRYTLVVSDVDTNDVIQTVRFVFSEE